MIPGDTSTCRQLPAFLIPVDQIAPDPDQPRLTWSEERLQQLAASIRASGIIQAILVSPHPEPRARAATPYMLIAGERRWLAARRAGLAAVPAILRTEPLSASDRLMLQIGENDPDLAEDLALFDLACAVDRAFQLAGCSQAQFASRHRRSQAWLSQILTFAHTEGPAREALEENRLQGALAARTFLRLPRAQQRSLLAESRRDGSPITLRRAERAAAQLDLRASGRAAATAVTGTGNPSSEAPAAPDDTTAAAAAVAAATPPACDPSAPAAEASAAPPAMAEPAANPGLTALAPPHPPYRATGLLPAHLKSHVEASGPPIGITFTPLQLVTLLILLGLEPAATPQEQVSQLLACL